MYTLRTTRCRGRERIQSRLMGGKQAATPTALLSPGVSHPFFVGQGDIDDPTKRQPDHIANLKSNICALDRRLHGGRKDKEEGRNRNHAVPPLLTLLNAPIHAPNDTTKEIRQSALLNWGNPELDEGCKAQIFMPQIQQDSLRGVIYREAKTKTTSNEQ